MVSSKQIFIYSPLFSHLSSNYIYLLFFHGSRVELVPCVRKISSIFSHLPMLTLLPHSLLAFFSYTLTYLLKYKLAEMKDWSCS